MNSVITDKKERERDRRLQKTYGISLEQYNQLLAHQNGKCAICGRLATDFKTNLNVDHKHIKITVIRAFKPFSVTDGIDDLVWGWSAWSRDFPSLFFWAKTKIAAITLAKEQLKPLTVRGLLCPGRHGKAGHGCCNRLLGRVDNRDWLLAAAAYLEHPPAKNILTNPTQTDTLNP